MWKCAAPRKEATYLALSTEVETSPAASLSLVFYIKLLQSLDWELYFPSTLTRVTDA